MSSQSLHTNSVFTVTPAFFAES